MINRILERLEETRWTTEFDMHCTIENAKLDNCIKIVQEVAKEYGDGWISCSERLPEYMEEVLVWHSDQNMHCVAWYNPSTKIWYSNDFSTEDSKYIVAWCELPAPYQKGE